MTFHSENFPDSIQGSIHPLRALRHGARTLRKRPRASVRSLYFSIARAESDSAEAHPERDMSFRLRAQLEEALGSVNRWYCSLAERQNVTDPARLLCYFIRSGGASDFARRYDEAMAAENRWYCSEFHGREIRDPEILWAYYKSHSNAGRLLAS